MLGPKDFKVIAVVMAGWFGISLVAVWYRMRLEVLHPRPFKWRALDEDGCKGFTDEPLDASELQYFKKLPTNNCNFTSRSVSRSFLYVTEDRLLLKIDKEKIKSLKLKVDYCKYASLRRAENDGDFKIDILGWSEIFTDSISLPENVDHIWGQCFKGKVVVGTSYASVVRKNSTLENILDKKYKKHVVENSPKETLSVLLIGLDGTSKLNFARQMPKTKSFVLKNLGGIEMYKVNKIGRNTFPNVVGLLTGRDEQEIKTIWKHWEYVDKMDYLYLWEDARRVGYRTSVMFDHENVTSFHWLKKGWKNPTFHYYNRPVVVMTFSDTIARKQHQNCVGDVHEVSLFYDYWLQLTRTFNNSRTTPYFGYSFFAHVTHDDINMASSVDEIYLQVFQRLAQQKSLNNTLILFFSDHGSRFGKFRNTFRGMLEDSNPFMFFIFPPWFEVKYPKVMANFRKNQHRLATVYDVHATLKDILNFQGDDIATREINNTNIGSISLFQKIPKRTCQQARIPIKNCNCRNFTSEGVTPKIRRIVSNVLLNQIVNKTEGVRSQCAVLDSYSVLSFMALFTVSTTHNYYQAAIETTPGGAIYEAVLSTTKTTPFNTSVEGNIARTNLYRGQADCIASATLRPFCFCSNLL